MGYVDEFMVSFVILDSLDMVCGNQFIVDVVFICYVVFVGVLVDDQFYVNSDLGECGIYFGFEVEVVGVVLVGVGGCGGCMFVDDVIQWSYFVLVVGVLVGIDDIIIEDDG